MNAVLKNQRHPQTVSSAFKTPAMPDWQLQDAKNRFSQVVRAARDGVPQWVTVHGKRAAVVLSADDYQAWLQGNNAQIANSVTAPKLSLLEELLLDSPGAGLTDDEIDSYFGRDRRLDTHRGIDL